MKTGPTALGRIIIHDRVKVEEKVLPRYFNHASFASLRRQLNYFSFVRMGKGRQRESTYMNEAVVQLDDILNLRRRSTTRASKEDFQDRFIGEHVVTTTTKTTTTTTTKPTKRRRPTPPPPRTTSPTTTNNFVSEVSEDEQDIVLDLTKQQPTSSPDAEVIAGCTALLGLHHWCF
jgi:hypothetical protein